jgi:hypothetical protein
MLWRRPIRRVDRDETWALAREQHAAVVNEHNALQQELTVVKRERDDVIASLRELQAAVQARWQAEARLAYLYRERELARARAAGRDPAMPLQ